MKTSLVVPAGFGKGHEGGEGGLPPSTGVASIPAILAKARTEASTHKGRQQLGTTKLEKAKLTLSPSLELATEGVQGAQAPAKAPPGASMLAEASIHEGRPQLVTTKLIKPEILPEGVAPQRPLASHGNPTLEVSALYYNPEEHTGWIYIMANKPNGIIYVGQTTNLPHRTWQHKEGKIEGFTKRYGCKTLVYFEGFPLITESIAREDTMKYWKRAWKIRRILETNPTWRDLYAEICQSSQH